MRKLDESLNRIGQQLNEASENLSQYGIKELKNRLTLEQLKKDFPWILEAKIKDAVLGYSKSYRGINWISGTWESGIWEDGVWSDGTWKDGTWKAGFWSDGTWKDGTWKAGFWSDGTWENGIWKGGTFFNGIWEDGIWEDGGFENGKWMGGEWKGGIFELSGKWLDKSNPKPKEESVNEANSVSDRFAAKQKQHRAKMRKKVINRHTGKIHNEAAVGANRKYTHFAVLKDTGEIVNGWDYKGYDEEDLMSDKASYFFDDLEDWNIKNIVIKTKKQLESKGIDPFDFTNWTNPVGESVDEEDDTPVKGYVVIIGNVKYPVKTLLQAVRMIADDIYDGSGMSPYQKHSLEKDGEEVDYESLKEYKQAVEQAREKNFKTLGKNTRY